MSFFGNAPTPPKDVIVNNISYPVFHFRMPPVGRPDKPATPPGVPIPYPFTGTK
jgi:hypothetical protein